MAILQGTEEKTENHDFVTICPKMKNVDFSKDCVQKPWMGWVKREF